MTDQQTTILHAKEERKAERISIVYFHGMGSQRRFEETSRLVDRFDTYLEGAFKREETTGKLRRILPRAEPGEDTGKPDVTYIRALLLRNKKLTSDTKFYEAYWADEMAETRSTWAVIKWILRQIWRPITMLWTPWRERQRVRRAALIKLLEQPDTWPEGTLETDFETLLKHYVDFDHPSWIRIESGQTAGKFSGFLTMIHHKNANKPNCCARLLALARVWKRGYVLTEIKSFALMLSLLLAILMVTGVLAAGAFAGLTRLPGLLEFFQLAEHVEIPDWAQASYRNAAALGFAALLAIGLRSFLVYRMADVEAWSTYSETDENFRKREAVLKKSVDLLSHVVNQDDCDRVVVVAHSLGASVAYDTLLAAVHLNRAVNPQDLMTGAVDFYKVSHFVTLASPIDKIAYFFESFRSPIRRYRKIYDKLRGDLGTPPFTKSGKQAHIHWVNIWDETDIISGDLQSPAAEKGIDARVDNVHVNSLAHFNPGAAHGAYFDNRTVIRMLFEIVFENRGTYTFENLGNKFKSDGEKDGLDYRSADFGPGSGQGTWRWALWAAFVAPWVWLIYLISAYLGCEPAETFAFGAAIVTTALPVLAFLLRFLRRPLADPLE